MNEINKYRRSRAISKLPQSSCPFWCKRISLIWLPDGAKQNRVVGTSGGGRGEGGQSPSQICKISQGPFTNDVSSIFRIYEGVPTLVCTRLLWLNDPLEETSFLGPTAPYPLVHLCTLWGSFGLYFDGDEFENYLYYHEIDMNQN